MLQPVDLSGNTAISKDGQRADKLFHLKSQITNRLFVYLISIWEEHRDESEVHTSLFYELNLHLEENTLEGLISGMRMNQWYSRSCKPARDFYSDFLQCHTLITLNSPSHMYAICSFIGHVSKAY